ncbi:hypothetical protein Vretimale_16548 [Volvox reticuliferus]|nr:hypothetical protein Vretifemale_8738 [Volvox reticuliferus]GIM13407.1 hypothetical protein Vretimale_16548 [Volvox reticuliferus]
MRPAYQCTEDDAGRWLRVTVLPLPTSSSGGRWPGNLESQASGTGPASNRPTLRAIAGPIMLQWSPAREQAPSQESQPQQSRLVVVEGQYTAVADGSHRLMVHLSPDNRTAECKARKEQHLQQLPPETQHSVGPQHGHRLVEEAQLYAQPVRSAVGAANSGSPASPRSARPSATLPTGLDEDRLGSVNHVRLSMPGSNLIQQQAQVSRLATNSSPCAPFLSPTRQPAKSNSSESSGHPSVPRAPSPVPRPPERPRFSQYSSSKHASLDGDATRYDSSGPAESHLPPPAASIRELASPNMKSSPGRGRSASPSSRPAGRLHEVIAGNYALSELQQWATGMALQQMSQSPQRSDAAVVPRPPASQYDNELQKLLKLAEDAGSSREPWLTNSVRSSSAQSVHTVPSQGYATALPTERRQWHGSSPPEVRPDQKSCLPSNAQPWRARPDSVPVAVGTGPDGPQQPLAGSRNDFVGSITEQPYWKRLLPERHPEQLEMPGASQSKYERSPRHADYMAQPSPFGGRDAYAYASAAAAGREARVSSQLPSQRLETVFQSTQDPQLGHSARRGDRVDEDVALSCLRDRLSAWQSQRAPNNGAIAPSTASAGAGTGTGGGSLREALEQLLAQHQEVVQQAALDAAASRISPQHQFPATAAPPLPDRHSMLAVERPGLQKSSAPEMRPYNSDDATRSGYQLGRQPPPPSQLQAPLVLDAHQSTPLVSRGSGASSVSLSNAFGVGLSGGITGRGIASHGLGSNDSDEEADPSNKLHNASPLGSLRTPGIDVAGESRKSPKVAVRERHSGHVAQPLQHAQVERDTEAVSAGLGLRADKGSTSADEYSKAGSDTAALLARLVEQGAEVGEKGSRSTWRLDAVGLPVMGKSSVAVDALDARIGAPIGDEHTVRRSDGRGDACGCSHAGKDSQPASQQAPSAAPASSSLQDMRNMNEALLRQLAESTRLQMQMQKALDAAMEQLIAFHAKEQQQQQRPEVAALTSPPRISSLPRQSPPAPQAPGSQLVGAPAFPPRQAPPPPDRPLSPSQQRLVAWIRDTAVEPAPPVGLTLPPRGFSSPQRRRLPHADVEVNSPIRRAASPEAGAVAQTGPEILHCTGMEAACMKAASTEDGNTTAARHRKVAMGPVSGTSEAGIRAGRGNGTGTGDDDAIAAAALRALLHQHHLRWRAKKAKLKEQAQAWQYTAWRYATAWKKARAMLQAMVAAQEGAVAPAQSIVNELPRPHHNLSLPQDNTVPKDVRPLASEVPAPPASTAVRQAEAGPVPGRAAEGPIDLRKLTEPGILAGITAALQRRDPSPGSVAGQRPSAYLTSDQGRLTGVTQSPGQVDDLALGARGPDGKAISAMRDAARTSPMRLRPRPHRKRATATAVMSVLKEDERDDMLLPPDKYHADKDARCKHSSLEGSAHPGNDVALDSLRDQGSRDYRAARRHDGADTAVNLERMEVAAHWPGTLRSGTDVRSRSTSPFSRPPWRNAGCASPTGIRVHRPVLDRDLPAQPDISWPLLPPEYPQPPKPPAVPYRDPDGWWHYPDGWLDIYQPRLPHMLVQSTTVRPQRHHHRYGSQGKVAPGGGINEFHLT